MGKAHRTLVPPRIEAQPPATPGLDLEAVSKEGRANLRQLAGLTWTDHNVHDPGITLLESIAYGWVDLAYRATTTMPQLLEAPSRHFFSADQMLPTAPVTADDLRRMLLDVQGVRDARVRPFDWHLDSDLHASGPLGGHVFIDQRTCRLKTVPEDGDTRLEVAGLLSIELALESARQPDDALAGPDDVLQRVRDAFHEARPLGCDLGAIHVLPSATLRICADLDLRPNADPALVRAEVLLALSHAIEPPVEFRSLAERRADGETVEELHTGPLANSGFLGRQLPEQPRRLHASDIYRVILSVEGVRLVSRLRVVVVNGAHEEGAAGRADQLLNDTGNDPIELPADATLRLDIDRSILRCFVGPVPQPPTSTEILRAHFDRLERRAVRARVPHAGPSGTARRGRAAMGAPLDADRDWPRDQLHSLQETLPAIYGVGRSPLPQSVSAERRGQAAQLQAYLLIFDQLRADFMAQLDAMPRLLSVRAEELDRSHFVGACDTVPGFGYLLPRAARASLEALLEGGDADRLERINTRLDHLLARYGDGFGPLEHALRGPDDMPSLIADKARLLRTLDVTSRDRGRGANLLASEPPAEALTRRLEARLGLAPDRIEGRSELPNPGLELFRDRLGDWRFRIVHEDGDIVLRSAHAHRDAESAWKACRATVRQMQRGRTAFRTLDPSARRRSFGFALDDDYGQPLAYSTDMFDVIQRSDAITRLVAMARTLDYNALRMPLMPGSVAIQTYPDRSRRLRFRVVRSEGEGLLVSTRGWGTPDELDAAICDMIRLGSDAENYEIRDYGQSIGLVLPSEDEAGLVAQSPLRFADEETAIAHRSTIADALADLLSNQAPQVIEHVLLRPRRTGAALMAHAPCTDGGACHVDDPYSHRLTIGLPAWAPQFADLRRRAAAEELVRMEAPAHLAVRICWLDRLTAFELRTARRRFFDTHRSALIAPESARARDERDAALDGLVARLSRVRSIYPEVRLHDCDQPNPAGSALLGHSRLGDLNVLRE